MRLSESRDTLASISAERRLEPARLTRLVRGELDWIVMKAVAKDRSRRYETANALARDIEHYLNDEPVEARPPSKSYQLRKFLRCHKGAVLAVGAVMLALVAGIVGTTWGMRKAVAAAAAERQAKVTAQTREAETRAVVDFVENKIFAAVRQETLEGGLGPDVKLRRAIEAALPFVDQSFREQPLTEARLRMALGTSFHDLGEPRIAAEQFARARTLYTSRMGAEHRDTLKSTIKLADAYAYLGRRADALKLREEALPLARAEFGPDDAETLRVMNSLAASYLYLGQRDDALKLFEETLARRNVKFGPEHSETLRTADYLALTFQALGRTADALKLHEETLA
jgi:tetratricopeptide (TPR) repeat protein